MSARGVVGPAVRGLLTLGATALGAAAAKYRADVNAPFRPTRYVWSRGLGLLCDKNGGVDYVKRQARGEKPSSAFDPAGYAGIREGDLVWVRSIALPQFLREVLPRVRQRFGLVTGDEDWAIPSGFADAGALLAHPMVAHWFAQNADGTDRSGKISPIPIGLDFHTISNGYKWGQWPASPETQEAALDAIVAGMPATCDRRLRVHSDFQFNRHKKQIWGDKRDAVEALLRGNPLVDFQPRKVPRRQLWEDKTRYAFVVSPHGNGLDCHRTWESLVLGNIVIVRRSPLDPLYEGLPVVIVDRWEDITQPNLERWRTQHAHTLDTPEARHRLSNAYWIAHMRNHLAQVLAS